MFVGEEASAEGEVEPDGGRVSSCFGRDQGTEGEGERREAKINQVSGSKKV